MRLNFRFRPDRMQAPSLWFHCPSLPFGSQVARNVPSASTRMGRSCPKHAYVKRIQPISRGYGAFLRGSWIAAVSLIRLCDADVSNEEHAAISVSQECDLSRTVSQNFDRSYDWDQMETSLHRLSGGRRWWLQMFFPTLIPWVATDFVNAY